VNRPGPGYEVEREGVGGGVRIRVPVNRVKGLGDRMLERLYRERSRGVFGSLADFYRRVVPSEEEMELLIRVGALDGFGALRTHQFWEGQVLHQRFGREASGQGWLLPSVVGEGDRVAPPERTEPTRRQRLLWEMELLGFVASGHPLELHDDVAWETYCPVSRLGEHVGEEVVVCGLVIEDRVHHQVTGEPMKFLTLCDWTGMVETELFAATYRSYGLATVRYPVLEILARVESYENGRGHSLRVLRAGRPRRRRAAGAQKLGAGS
jgi:DNA polymerase III alpha subunit